MNITNNVLQRFAILFLALTLSFNIINAHPIDDAKKMMAYERYTKSINILQEFLKNIKLKENEIEEATYYLGRAYILNNQTEEARVLYQNYAKANSASPLNMVGLGTVLLLDNKINEAQTLFDNAILQTKSKDPLVYAALAFAYVKAKNADHKYAQVKFTQVSEKMKKNAEYYIALGDFYKRLKYGNDVYTNYSLALSVEPQNATAKYKLGRLFLSQNNKSIFVQNMLDVIMLDKQYAPAYYQLYLHYYNIDVAKAKEYFLKYREHTDSSPLLEFEEASVLYASKDFQGAINQGLKLIDKYKDKVEKRCYRLVGYGYNKIGDSVNALKYLNTFFSLIDADDVDFDNYRKMAEILEKFQDKTNEAIQYYEKAYTADTDVINKLSDVKMIIKLHKKNKNNKMLAHWNGIYYNMNPKQSSTDLFNWGYAALVAEEFVLADTIFSTYIEKYPTQYFGYYWKARTKYSTDTTMQSAIPLYLKTIEITQIDSIKYKNILVPSYSVLYEYYRNKLKDFETALVYLNKIVSLKPEEAELVTEKANLEKYIEEKKKADTFNNKKK